MRELQSPEIANRPIGQTRSNIVKSGILADQTTGGDDVIDVVLRANLFYRSGDNQEDNFRFVVFAQNGVRFGPEAYAVLFREDD